MPCKHYYRWLEGLSEEQRCKALGLASLLETLANAHLPVLYVMLALMGTPFGLLGLLFLSGQISSPCTPEEGALIACGYIGAMMIITLMLYRFVTSKKIDKAVQHIDAIAKGYGSQCLLKEVLDFEVSGTDCYHDSKKRLQAVEAETVLS